MLFPQMNIINILAKKLKNEIELFVFDYDGTIYDKYNNDYNHKRAFSLIKKVINNGCSCLVVSARCASFLHIQLQNLRALYNEKGEKKETYIGGGNGTMLFSFSKSGLSTLYENKLSFKEVTSIMKMGKKVYDKLKIDISDLNAEGMLTHADFLKTVWGQLIPKKFIALSKLYEGMCFCEEAKVSFVLPNNLLLHDTILHLFKKEIKLGLKGSYHIVRGDIIFLQISKTFPTDPKLHALNTIINKLKIALTKVAVFGNMPQDNDKGILISSHLPNTFTNAKSDISNPPFYIDSHNRSSVAAVHHFVKRLIE